ncbi:MAG: Rieske 2Fe-2S domain-containing protein [Candidatus Bathyarchaeia archaeon]
MSFVKVAETSEIPLGKMKHVEVNGKEMMLANVDGKIYATSDRCSHMNARLSMGTLDKNIVTCPQHFSRFDVITGKMVSGPVEMTGRANIFEKCPEEVQKTISQLVQRQREIQKFIKTYDQPTYEVKAEGNDILVRV